jgi:hypothetical protein
MTQGWHKKLIKPGEYWDEKMGQDREGKIRRWSIGKGTEVRDKRRRLTMKDTSGGYRSKFFNKED